MRRCAVRAVTLIAIGCAALVPMRPAAADTGDPRGWSLIADAPKRTFLIWVPVSNGPRQLTFGCLRDVNSFTIMSDDVASDQSPSPATLTLSNRKARYDAEGQIASDDLTRKPAFSSELDADRKALREIGHKLLPVLEGRGPIAYQIVIGPRPKDISASDNEIPVAGLTQPLKRFRTLCFGP